VLKQLRNHDIWLNKKKSKFSKTKVIFLSMVISRKELRIEPEKTKIVREWPISKTVKEVQAFLRFANYY